METIHEENLCTAIFRRLNKIGFNERNIENEYIHLNFIMYFLKRILPISYFSEENYELTTSSDGIIVNFKGEEKTLVIKSIYEEDKCLLEISYGENTMYFSSVDNPICVFIDDGKTGEIFKTDKNEGTFTYHFKSVGNDSIKSEELYCGQLAAINSCIDNKEYFIYERIYPKTIPEASLWQTIRNRKHRKRVIPIAKSNPDFTIYDDIITIFSELQKEKDFVMSAQEETVRLVKRNKKENA